MINQSKKIGKILRVDSSEVLIELEKDIPNLIKSTEYGIDYIGRINSFLVIKNSSSQIIAQVIRISVDEEKNSDDEMHFIRDKKILVAKLIGEIKEGRDKNNRYVFDYGITNYPLLSTPVEFITEKQLDIIFNSSETNQSNDFNLKIGKSAVFEKYDVKIDPNIFFGKHAAILGNTGSGKSCTVTAILQSIFLNPNVVNGHFIIFDTNGEYKKAFTSFDAEEDQTLPQKTLEMLKRINPICISADETIQTLKIPHWFLNLQEYKDLFRPSEQNQLPVMNKALSLAKLPNAETINRAKYTETYLYYSFLLIRQLFSDLNKGSNQTALTRTQAILININSALTSAPSELEPELKTDAKALYQKLKSLYGDFGKIKRKVRNTTTGKISEQEISLSRIQEICDEYLTKNKPQEEHLINPDKPRYFDFESFINEYLPLSMLGDEIEGNQKVREYCSTLLVRIKDYYTNGRYDFLFKNPYFKDSVAIFLRFITGLYSIGAYSSDINPIGEAYLKQIDDSELAFDKNKINQVIIIDLSSLRADVIENVTAIIGRLILDFLQQPDLKRGSFPICMILEEAHRYIPENNDSPAKIVFERIAKEGRKFGLGLVISSQRPSELSRTVLSQCNTFIVHKLQNPDDLYHIKRMTSYMSEEVLNQLPVIPKQYALVFGEAVRFPILFKVNDANPRPKSEDSEFSKHWLDAYAQYPEFETIGARWSSTTVSEDVSPNQGSDSDIENISEDPSF